MIYASIQLTSFSEERKGVKLKLFHKKNAKTDPKNHKSASIITFNVIKY